MCNKKEKLYIHNINRVAIACASVIAMLIDGINLANGLYLVSAIFWLFLPECDAAEEQLLDCIKGANFFRKNLRTVARILASRHYN